MPATIQDQAAAVLARRRTSSALERFVDLRVVWKEWGDSDEIILDAGGRWDRLDECYVDDGDTCLELRMQPAQYEAAYWWAGWLPEYLAGGRRSPEYDRKWTLMGVGGRRSGKTDFFTKAATTLCAVRPKTMAWAASPTEELTVELHDVFAKMVPLDWAEYAESKLRWFFLNGSVLEYRSGFKPSALKRGRCDFGFLNEAQYFPKRSYGMVRGAIGDSGGLVALAGNPPDEPIGQWLLEMHGEAKAGLETVKLIEFDPELNPVVDQAALDDMKNDLGEDDYRRDRLGEFIPIGDLVWYAWSPRFNVRPAGELQARTHKVEPMRLAEMTREFTKRHLGREFDHVLGADFQLTPHMAVVECGFYRNPLDVADPYLWARWAAAVEGTEDELADVVLEAGYDPDRTAWIVDASGWWQDAERTKGRGSVDMLKAKGFRFIFRPDRAAKRNPHIFERVQASNARFCSAAGDRRVYSVPESRELNTALASWENRNGVPYRRSPYAHFSDALSYVIWRFWPRHTKRRKLEFEKGERKRSQRERDLDGF